MSATHRILVVDHDAAFRRELAEQLALHEGFRVEQADSVEAAVAAARASAHDAIVVDVDLPDGDGRALCRRLRREGIRCPILLLASRDGDAEAILGLDSGANDFVAKPVRLGVLMARLRAHLRQYELADDATFQIGPYSFRPAVRMLVDGHKRIHLTEKETAILKYLYRMADRPVSRAVLLGEVWGYNSRVSTHTLETHIYRLRQKLEPEPGNYRYLVTEPEGYRLVRSPSA